MVILNVSDFVFSKTATPQGRPLLNSAASFGGPGQLINIKFNYRQFWNWFKSSPELVSTISIPIVDTLGERPEWTDLDGKPLGRNKRLDAERFWSQNRLKEVTSAVLTDYFLTGDGYYYKAVPTKKEIATAFKETLRKRGFNLSLKEIDMMVKESYSDEDFTKPRKVDYVASSTVTILNDAYDVKGYKQVSQGKTEVFDPSTIIHIRYMTINGEVHGFTPVAALASELVLLQLIKGNMVAYLRNGGMPEQLYILPKELAGSSNYNLLVDQLKSFKAVENRHGSLVFTGEVDVQKLQDSPKDLEYKELALYITSNFAFSFGIPVSRIPYLIGSSASKGDSGGLAESGYWNRISFIQDNIEDTLNNQLFMQMGWKIKFNRKYKHDEVREAQTMSMMADTVQKMQQILSATGKTLSQDKISQILDLAPEDIEEVDPAILAMQAGGGAGMNQNMLSNGQVLSEPDKQAKNNVKRNSANQKGSKEAATHP